MIQRFAVLALALVIAGCGSVPKRGGGYYEDDGPHDRAAVDVSQVPDAVPRVEPKSATGNQPYAVFGIHYVPLASAAGYHERGVASWYGKKFHGKRTSSGDAYDMYAMTAAHKTLPIPSYARVTNLENGRSVVVRVNDRGPFLHSRLIDLSYAAAWKLGILGTGTGLVDVESIDPAAPATPVQTVSARPAVSFVAAAEASTGMTKNGASARLSVQAGAFTVYENAVALCQRLERAGLGPVYIQSPAPGSPPTRPALHRVRIGPVGSVEQGDRVVEEMARRGIPDALLVVE